MAIDRFWISSVERKTIDGVVETLRFEPGVNVLVGPPNSGKTRWLNTIDYLFGESGSPADALGEDVAEKYSSATLRLDYASASHLEIERSWGPGNVRSRHLVNGEIVSATDFSGYFLDRNGMPRVQFPLGNPYSQRSWREISWRMVLRHVYRQERYWTDFADLQSPREQAAALLQLVDLAEQSFPPQLGDQIGLRVRRASAEARMIQFNDVMADVARDLGLSGDDGIESPDLARAADELTESLADAEGARLRLIQATASDAAQSLSRAEREEYEGLVHEWTTLQGLAARQRASLQELATRLNDLTDYAQSVEAESQRMQRTTAAVGALDELRATHCPVCDRPIDLQPTAERCYLCTRPFDDVAGGRDAAAARLSFEEAQLRDELQELTQLIGELRNEHQIVEVALGKSEDRLAAISDQLRPYRDSSATVISPELSSLDRQIGLLGGQARLVERITRIMGSRDSLRKEIEEIDWQLRELDDVIERQVENAPIAWTQESSRLSASMNAYLRSLNSATERKWPEGIVSLDLNTDRIAATVSGRRWSAELGATLACYFLLSYHFALLESTGRNSNYPGLVILDFPPELLEGDVIGAGQNFLLEPFVDLISSGSIPSGQVIAAGRAFADLPGANRIELADIWL